MKTKIILGILLIVMLTNMIWGEGNSIFTSTRKYETQDLVIKNGTYTYDEIKVGWNGNITIYNATVYANSISREINRLEIYNSTFIMKGKLIMLELNTVKLINSKFVDTILDVDIKNLAIIENNTFSNGTISTEFLIGYERTVNLKFYNNTFSYYPSKKTIYDWCGASIFIQQGYRPKIRDVGVMNIENNTFHSNTKVGFLIYIIPLPPSVFPWNISLENLVTYKVNNNNGNMYLKVAVFYWYFLFVKEKESEELVGGADIRIEPVNRNNNISDYVLSDDRNDIGSILAYYEEGRNLEYVGKYKVTVSKEGYDTTTIYMDPTNMTLVYVYISKNLVMSFFNPFNIAILVFVAIELVEIFVFLKFCRRRKKGGTEI